MGHELATKQKSNLEFVSIIAFHSTLRPPLPLVIGSVDYDAQRRLFVRVNAMLSEAKLDHDFLAFACKGQGTDLARLPAKKAAAFAQCG